MPQQNTITLTGTLNYIDSYKRLFLSDLDACSVSALGELDIRGKSPVSEYEGKQTVRVNLDKYSKPYMSRYESLLKQKVQFSVTTVYYDSEEYGTGTTLRLLKYKKLSE